MRELAEIKSCLDVTDDDIRAALAPARSLSEPGPRERTLGLIAHMATLARPDQGAPKLLLVLAHLATRDFLDGELVVKLIGDDDVSVLELFVDDGLSRMRLLGPARIDCAFQEFRVALSLHAALVLPLVVQGQIEERRVELRALSGLRQSSMPPSFSAVSPSLLPLVGGGDRVLPDIVSQPPASLEPAALPFSPKRPVSMPPHVRAALDAIKKK